MFWNLLLAHFIADYPLQPTWIVRNKKHGWVIGLHSAIQFAVMGVLLLPLSLRIWPALLAVATIHFLIDLGKIKLGQSKPKWVALPYVFDQVLHFAILALVVIWLAPAGPGDLFFIPRWSIYTTAFLVVTYVWFITERVLYYADEEYFREVLENFGGRMAVRLALLGSSIIGMVGLAGWAAILGIAALIIYRSSAYRWRAILIDTGVSIFGMVYIWLALSANP